jgi:hypothetical protein
MSLLDAGNVKHVTARFGLGLFDAEADVGQLRRRQARQGATLGADVQAIGDPGKDGRRAKAGMADEFLCKCSHGCDPSCVVMHVLASISCAYE